MELRKKQISRGWIELLLTIISGLIYFWHFPEVFLNPNSILAGITGDALKNYYTFAFHALKDDSLLHFSGMNFPYGEHIVYTDCQPLLSTLLRFIPFLHPFTIGLLHYLLFFSFILSPLIIYRIFQKLSVNNFTAFFASIAIVILAPQFQKISGGHHGLAYGCAIPLSVLFSLNYLEKADLKRFWILLSFNLFLFFIHPYMGFAASLLSAAAVFITYLLAKEKKILPYMQSLAIGIFPMIVFKLFMKLTDQHADRVSEPFGKNTLLENKDSLLAPDFGPFQVTLEKLFSSKTQHLEGHSYLGIFVIFLTLFCFIFCLTKLRNLKADRGITGLFLASLFLLFISFGWHQKLLDSLGITSQSLNQFRAACRFAWSFYFILPIYIFHLLSRNINKVSFVRLLPTLALVYLLFNLVESHAYFNKDRDHFWKYRNLFNKDLLLADEQNNIQRILASHSQAIVALPIFHLGSETFARPGSDASMIPAFFYSFHTGIPILGASMSRISISETRNSLNLLNSYASRTDIASILNKNSLTIITSKDELMPDEERLIKTLKNEVSNDSLSIGFMSQDEFLSPKKQATAVKIANDSINLLKSIIFVSEINAPPFASCNLDDYHNAFVLKTRQLPTGPYVISYQIVPETLAVGHYPDLIIARREKDNYFWERMYNEKTVSGFYDQLLVFEFTAELDQDSGYEFILKGTGEGKYHIKHFLIRPSKSDCYLRQGAEKEWNNFPELFTR